MIVSKTPFRISFFGGGSDFPAWYQKNGGAVLSTTINKYCYISVRPLPPFFDYKHRIVYSNIELVKEIKYINHPSVREVMKALKVEEGLEIHHDGDLPARSGLGSSSSFTVGLVNAINALRGFRTPPDSLAQTAITIEQDAIGEAVGSQDQVAAAYGGFNKILFNSGHGFNAPAHNIQVEPVIIPQENLKELESGLCLFYTGVSRLAADIEKDKLKNFHKRKEELRELTALVDEGIKVLGGKTSQLTREFGNLLHQGWLRKRKLSKKVDTTTTSRIYAKATKLGIYGGKLLGAGGGGFILFCIEPHRRQQLIDGMKPLIHVPFKFEPLGSQIALYAPNSW